MVQSSQMSLKQCNDFDMIYSAWIFIIVFAEERPQSLSVVKGCFCIVFLDHFDFLWQGVGAKTI